MCKLYFIQKLLDAMQNSSLEKCGDLC